MTFADFSELAASRYSVRKFTEQPVSQNHLDKILQVSLLAPTACNRQPQQVLVINTPESLDRLKKCTGSHFNAPAALLVCYNREQCWVRDYDQKPSGEIDAAIVATHMMLEAASLGLGTTWVMHFIPEAVRCEFSLPDVLEPVALLVLGYPAPDAQPSPMHKASQPLQALTAYGQF